MAKLARLSGKGIAQRLAKLKGWQRKGDAITKEFVLNSFTGAARFISRIAPIANDMDHHPDLELDRYKRVKIVLTTHSAGDATRYCRHLRREDVATALPAPKAFGVNRRAGTRPDRAGRLQRKKSGGSAELRPSAGGITQNDFALAAKIDKLAPTSESWKA